MLWGNKKRIRGQVAVELFMLIGILALFSITILLIASDKTQRVYLDNEYIASKDFGFSMQKEILIASEVDDGYLRNFDVPADINGIDYQINISNGSFVLKTSNFEHIFYVPYVAGQFNIGALNRINRTAGTIYIN